MTTDDLSRSRERYHDVWRPLISAAESGELLTPGQLRALWLRQRILETLRFFTPAQLHEIHEGHMTPEQAAQALQLGHTALQDMKPNPGNLQIAAPDRPYTVQLQVAERLGKYWATDVDFDALSPLEDTLLEIEQHTSGSTETALAIDKRPKSAAAEKWVDCAAAADHDGPVLLAAGLGTPDLPAQASQP